MAGADFATKSDVRGFWEADPCGSEHGTAPEGSREFFVQVERRRNQLEPFIADYADFAGSRGRKVLEIGVGMGSDFVRWARAGADAHGVDLTDHAIELTERRLAHEGLSADLRRADAESLPFEDATFDKVYSWGVLHHTPDTERAIGEAIRVLRPGGELCIMLYARISWVAFGMWFRHALLARRPFRSLADVLYHHMESPGTTAYTRRELRRIFAGMDDVRIDKVGTAYDRQMAGRLAGLSGRQLGWFLVTRARKPAR